MKIFEDEKTDRFGNYPSMWIKGKDANPQKIHEELYRRYGGQGYKFAIVFDCSADEWEDPEKETPVYFLDTILDELISYCGLEEPKENPEFEGKKIELYLVTVKGTKYPFRAFWNGKQFTDGWSVLNVIAWHPLPETYQEERSEV